MKKTCSYLEWDSKHFDIRIGRVNKENIRKKDFSKIDNWARKNRIDCLYLLSEGETTPKIKKELNNGFIHVDTRVELSLQISKLLLSRKNKIDFKVEILKSINKDILFILDNSIKGTRFYNDNNFSKNKVKELYHTWIKKNFENNSVRVFGALRNSKVIGFLSIKSINSQVSKIDLVAVESAYTGSGVGSEILRECLRIEAKNNIKEITVVTQKSNFAALSFYEKIGFRMVKCSEWYHKWFQKK